MIEKNDIVTLTIKDIGAGGEGVAIMEGCAVFVKDAMPGDVVRAKITKMLKNYGYGKVEEIISPSEYRVEAACGIARRCGGCIFQEMSYDRQLEYKEAIIDANLSRIGKVSGYKMHGITGMDEPYRYRNKSQFPVGLSPDGKIIMGFYAGRTHSIIPCEDCVIGAKINGKILNIIRGYMEDYGIRPYDEKNFTGLIRHILIRNAERTGEIMVCIIINGKELPHKSNLVKRLLEIKGMTSISYNINTDNTNVIMGDEVVNIFGEGYITDYIGDTRFNISPLSFFQVNSLQTEKLYAKVIEFADLTGNETVWDLYCGVGTISIFLAKNMKRMADADEKSRPGMVHGVEIVPQAIKDAKNNAAINGVDNVIFHVGKAEEIFPEYCGMDGRIPDVVILDPPRKGCDERVLRAIAGVKIARIVYVSCDSATLARDVRYLCDNGYELTEVQPVDMFPHTRHVETVVKLSLKTDTPKIEVTMEPDTESNFTPAERGTYQNIKDYIREKYGLKVHTLYIAQIKDKCGLDKERTGNGRARSEDAKVPEVSSGKRSCHYGCV